MWIDQRGSEVLTEAECHQLLAIAAKEGAIGRLAVSVSGAGAPIVVPVNFAVQDHQILIRIGAGTLADCCSLRSERHCAERGSTGSPNPTGSGCGGGRRPGRLLPGVRPLDRERFDRPR